MNFGGGGVGYGCLFFMLISWRDLDVIWGSP